MNTTPSDASSTCLVKFCGLIELERDEGVRVTTEFGTMSRGAVVALIFVLRLMQFELGIHMNAQRGVYQKRIVRLPVDKFWSLQFSLFAPWSRVSIEKVQSTETTS